MTRAIGAVVANMSMSLDGYIEDSGGGVEHLFGWYDGGSTSMCNQQTVCAWSS